MSITLTRIEVPLAKLELHPRNVRAKSPETYEAEDIAGLAQSIAAVGLLNPLTVQKTGKTWGVLAGGRRLAALMALEADETALPYADAIPCNEVPQDFDATVALSFAENDTQRPMDAIDEFDAFAAMADQGMTSEAIARAIGVTEAKVKGRLRFGLVAPEIRAAARNKTITLDVMKAFADHPDPAVQIDLYKALRETGQLQTWVIRERLRERGIKMTDALAQLVADDYRARGGEIAGDLLPEHSVLSDEALANTILGEKLTEAAEAARAEHGFAWAEVLKDYDWNAFNAYGHVYPGEAEPDEAGQARLDEISARLAEIEEQLETEDLAYDAREALDDEWETLSQEATALQEAYDPDDLERAGVIAYWAHGRINVTAGLVRPEDTPAKAKSTSETEGEDGIALNASLAADLAVERAIALGAALCEHHALAEDLMRFKIVTDILGRMPVSYCIKVSASTADRPHGKPEGFDRTALEQLDAFRDSLDLGFLEAGGVLDQFTAFRALKPSMKAKIVALAMAHTIAPSLANDKDCDLFSLLEPEILPNVRERWRPTGDAFFGRIKKEALMVILAKDLGLNDEAANLAGAKKGAVVEFLDRLFAEPFATLSDDQVAAVEAWAPPGMQVGSGLIADSSETMGQDAIAAE